MSEPKGMKTRYKTTNWAAYNAALKTPSGHPNCPTYGHPKCSTLAAVI